MTNESESYEVDCPWFDPMWLIDHPDFPLATVAVDESNTKEECNW